MQNDTLIFSEGIAVASGVVMLVTALLLWLHHPKRPDWGLSWVALAMLLGAISNLVSPLFVTAAWRAGDLNQAVGLIALFVGFGSLAALVLGVHAYVLKPVQHPWRMFLIFWLIPPMLVVINFLTLRIQYAGDILGAGIFIYCGWLTFNAARQKLDVGHGVITLALFSQPLTVIFLTLTGSELSAARYISAIPYTVVAMVFLSASLNRIYHEHEVELEARTKAQKAAESAQAELVISRNIQEAILQNAPVPLAITPIVDETANCSKWNYAWYKTFGYPVGSKDGLGGHDFNLYVDPDIRHHFANKLVQCGFVEPFEAELITAAGEIRLCLIEGVTINTGGDRIIITSYIDITEQRLNEKQLEKANRIGTAVAKAQYDFIHANNYHVPFNTLLDDILSLTSSEYGFIGEVLHNAEGQPYLKTFAISNIAWNNATQKVYEEQNLTGMEFTNLRTLFGEVIANGCVVIANDPKTDPRSGGLPPGHPPLRAFLGVPIYHGTELIAMFGMANRPGGYDQDIVDYLAPLTGTIGQLIMAIRYDKKQKETKQQLNSISNNLPNSMVFRVNCGKDGKKRDFVYVSKGVEQLHGLSPQDVTNNPNLLYDQIHPDDSDALRIKELNSIGNLVNFSSEYRCYSPNGELRWFYINSSPYINSDGEIIFDGIEIDITRQKCNELELHEERERLRGILDGTRAGTWEVDLVTDTLVVNERWAQMLGFELRELAPFTLDTWRNLVHPEDIQPKLDILDQHLSGITDYYTAEFRMRHKLGHWVWVQASGKVISTSESGKPQVLRGTHLEITERKLAEQQLQELNTTLETRVSERTEELSLALANLRQTQQELIQSEKLAALGSLVAGVAHELNTPIGNAVTVASTLNEACEEFRQKTQTGLTRTVLNNFVSSIDEAGTMLMRNLERAAGLVSSFKKVAVDQNSHQRQSIALSEVLLEVKLVMTPGLRKSDVQMQIDCDPAIHLDSYPGALTQALMILINNATTHAFEGCKEPCITITCKPKGNDRVVLTVADNGRGASPEVINRIFEPFYTSKLGKGGSGLGMHIFYNLVTVTLGGKTWIESTLGEGLAVHIDLPVSAPEISHQNTTEQI